MKKKILVIIIAVLSIFTLFSCTHEHEFSNAWIADETHHYRQCSCGEKSQVLLHNWDNGVELSAPTYEEEGVKLFTCVTCGKTRTESIPKLYESTVTISVNMPNAITFLNETLLTQTINNQNPDYRKVSFYTNFGYKYLYYEVNGEKCYDNFIDFDAVKENKEVRLICEYSTTELPIINVDTAGEEINSKEDYVEMTFDIQNCDDEFTADGGIRLRGNSTLNFDKKAYRIKFDKKQSFFGLEKAKSWVLLAEYLDPSALHNYAAFTIASELDGLTFTPSPHKVNLYLNGKFQGLYTLCEQVQENEGRLDIEVDVSPTATKITDYNFFVCMDSSVVGDNGAEEGENYFYLDDYDRYFELKYPEKDAFPTTEQFNSFFNALKTYIQEVMDAYADLDYTKITALTDTQSLIDFWLVDEIMGELDHSSKSFNMYFESTNNGGDGKLKFGPVWDYDWSLFTNWTNEPNQNYTIARRLHYSNIFFGAIRDINQLNAAAQNRYLTVLSPKLNDIANNMASLAQSMENSFALNAQKWYHDYDAQMTKQNVDFLVASLKDRKIYLDGLWQD